MIDVADPALPVELGFLDTPDFAYGVTVVGTLAYVADGSSGLRVIRTAAALPVEIGFLDTPSLAVGVAVVGTLAYVADGPSGLRVIDVADPALPVEIGFLVTPGSAYSVTVVGTLAYVADLASGLRVIDVADPALPVELGFLDTPGEAAGVAVGRDARLRGGRRLRPARDRRGGPGPACRDRIPRHGWQRPGRRSGGDALPTWRTQPQACA